MRPTAALAILALAALLTAAPGCKKKAPSYDRKSPEKTLTSFAKALEKGRIPADLEMFFVSPYDISSWKMRCKTRGCTKLTFKVVGKKSEDSYSATYLVDFTVLGTGNARVMQAKAAPIKFVYQDGSWYIEQMGVFKQIPQGGPAGGDAGAAAPPKDAAAAAAPGKDAAAAKPATTDAGPK